MRYLFFVITAFIIFTGCEEKSQQPLEKVSKYSVSGSNDNSSGSNNNIPVQSRMLIKEYYLLLETSEYEKSANEINSVVNKFGGYVEASGTRIENDAKTGTFTIRIPTAKLEEFVSFAKKLADKVADERISSEDITEAYIDIQARMENKKKVEEQYRELLKKASSVDEIIRVEKELAEIRTEIESAQARLKYFDSSVKMSKVTIEIYEPDSRYGSEPGFFRIIKNSFNTGIHGFFYVVGFLIILILSSIPLIIIGYILNKFIRISIKRYRERKK